MLVSIFLAKIVLNFYLFNMNTKWILPGFLCLAANLFAGSYQGAYSDYFSFTMKDPKQESMGGINSLNLSHTVSGMINPAISSDSLELHASGEYAHTAAIDIAYISDLQGSILLTGFHGWSLGGAWNKETLHPKIWIFNDTTELSATRMFSTYSEADLLTAWQSPWGLTVGAKWVHWMRHFFHNDSAVSNQVNAGIVWKGKEQDLGYAHRTFQLGLSATNLFDGRLNNDAFPRMISAGGGIDWTGSTWSLLTTVEAQMLANSSYWRGARTGLELGWKNTVFVRGGFSWITEKRNAEQESCGCEALWTLGGGVQHSWKHMTAGLDAAWYPQYGYGNAFAEDLGDSWGLKMWVAFK